MVNRIAALIATGIVLATTSAAFAGFSAPWPPAPQQSAKAQQAQSAGHASSMTDVNQNGRRAWHNNVGGAY